MSWSWFVDRCAESFRPLRVYLRRHPIGTFRVLLLSGNLLLLALLWYLQPVFQHHQQYYIWMAGLTATLSMLFVFSIWSAQINGYRRYRDSWLGFATGMMLMLSIALTLIALQHA